jgi:Zn-dependent peptidase ImmA (M78 family)
MFNPTRLTIARKRRGLTKLSLAKAARLSARVVTMYEAGETAPSAETLDVLAGILRFPPAFFSGPDIEEPSADGASFRALAAMTAGQRDMALSAGALAIELGRWIDARFELPAPDVPVMRGFEPEAAAQALRAQWGLGERTIKNMVHLVESHGVRVFSLPRDSASVNAFSVWHREAPFIFLTTDKSGERGRFDAAHELAHLVLHRHGGPGSRTAELEADRFASAFLMPRSSVLAAAPRSATLAALIQLKKRWGVSLAALVHRLRSLEMLSEWQYRSLCIDLAQRGYRREEPEGLPRESSQVLAKVLASLRQENIGRGTIARELLIETSELDALIFGLVLGVVTGGKSEPSGRTAARNRANLSAV